jgi:putative transposase
VFLLDSYGYLIALSRIGLRSWLDYGERNQFEKWYQTLAMRIVRSHQPWVGSEPRVRRWLAVFVQYYNFHRPNQTLNEQTPTDELY